MHRRRLYMKVESIENDEEKKQYRMSIVNQTIEMRAMQKVSVLYNYTMDKEQNHIFRKSSNS